MVDSSRARLDAAAAGGPSTPAARDELVAEPRERIAGALDTPIPFPSPPPPG